MDRRTLLVIATGALATPLVSKAQRVGKIHRIGLMAVVPTPNLMAAWREGLRERGWAEGQNLVVEERFSRGVEERFQDFAFELVRSEVDAIVAVTDPAVRAAMRATTTIPIVIAAGTDPIASGFVVSLAKPGGNVTGMPIFADELAAKQLALLKETLPRMTRVTVLAGVLSGQRIWSALQVAGPKLDLRLEPLVVGKSEDLEGAFDSITKQRPDAILVLPTGVMYAYLARIVEFAAKNRLPAMYPFSEAVHAGGLMCYATALPDLFRRIGGYVDKVLKGTKPADLPVEQPTKFELVINLKTAKALGITIPPSLLLRADQVIE